jgi:hypothetical protein
MIRNVTAAWATVLWAAWAALPSGMIKTDVRTGGSTTSSSGSGDDDSSRARAAGEPAAAGGAAVGGVSPSSD